MLELLFIFFLVDFSPQIDIFLSLTCMYSYFFEFRDGKEKFNYIIDALKKLDKLSDSLLGDQEEIPKSDHIG